MKPRVLLDIDGVIADFYYGFADFLNKNYGCSLDLLNEPHKYNFTDWGCGIEAVDTKKAINEWILGGGFEALPPFSGAKAFVEELMGICNVYIVTARVGDWEHALDKSVAKKVKNDTYSWFKKHNIPGGQVVFTKEKIDFCKDHGIGLMIEDKLTTALKGAKDGINTILVNKNYNESPADRFKIHRAYSYKDVINIIGKLYK